MINRGPCIIAACSASCCTRLLRAARICCACRDEWSDISRGVLQRLKRDAKHCSCGSLGLCSWLLLLLLLLLLHVHLTVLLLQLSRLLLVSPFVSPLVSPLVLLVRMQRCCTDARLPCSNCCSRLAWQQAEEAAGSSICISTDCSENCMQHHVSSCLGGCTAAVSTRRWTECLDRSLTTYFGSGTSGLSSPLADVYFPRVIQAFILQIIMAL